MDVLPTHPPSPSLSDSMSSSPLKRRASSLSLRRPIPDNFKVMNVPKLPDDIRLPPLPVIKNKLIEKQVFTHSSVSGQARTRVNFEVGDGKLQDNEKLEWVGDGILSKFNLQATGNGVWFMVLVFGNCS